MAYEDSTHRQDVIPPQKGRVFFVFFLFFSNMSMGEMDLLCIDYLREQFLVLMLLYELQYMRRFPYMSVNIHMLRVFYSLMCIVMGNYW